MSTVTATYYHNDAIGGLKPTIKPRQIHGTQQTNAMPHYGGGAEKCARCSKNVYLAEKKTGAGRSFHSSCFSCETCNRKLDATTLSEHKGEIYCKTCYTRQFGVHGLISGVTMTTEQPARENRPARRSSYGSDLAAPQQQVRQRAHSNDNALRAETSAITNDEVPKMFPWRNDVLPEQPLNQDAEKSRPISQIGFEKLVESTKSDEQTTVYPHATSALLDMPVISPPKRTNSTTIERLEMPTVILDHKPRSRSPSPVDSDVFQRQVTQEQSADISENFARLTLGEINSYLYANEDLTTAKLVSETPIIDQTSSNENTPHAHHSRDSSPSVKENNSRSTSPTSGYNSSNAHVDRISRDSTASPPSAFVPEHKYLIAQDSSPKTNNLPSPTIGGKYSTIAALIKPHRPVSQIGTPTNE